MIQTSLRSHIISIIPRTIIAIRTIITAITITTIIIITIIHIPVTKTGLAAAGDHVRTTANTVPAGTATTAAPLKASR